MALVICEMVDDAHLAHIVNPELPDYDIVHEGLDLDSQEEPLYERSFMICFSSVIGYYVLHIYD